MKRKPYKTAVLLLSLLIVAISGLYLSHRMQPEYRFASFRQYASTDPADYGLKLRIDRISRNKDGSGSIEFTFWNPTDEVKYWWPPRPGNRELWVDYLDREGVYHMVYPPPMAEPMSASGYGTLEPGEAVTGVEPLPEKTLAVPGAYRFCVTDVGWVDFEVDDHGEISIHSENVETPEIKRTKKF